MAIRIYTLPNKLFISSLPNGLQEFSCYLCVENDETDEFRLDEITWSLEETDSGTSSLSSKRSLTEVESKKDRFWISATVPSSWTGADLRVVVRAGDKVYSEPFVVERFVCGNEFCVPLDGQVIVLTGHRLGEAHRSALEIPSQQFGWDLLPLDDNGLSLLNGPITDSLGSNDMYGFGKVVRAVGPGKVVKVINGYADHPKVGAVPVGREYFLENLERATGNCIVIDHGNGIHSCYAHLMLGSMKVEELDTVEAGQVIALLGNSGNSTGPHLHFHFMDGANVLEASPLPIGLTMEGQCYAPIPGEFICN
jgi:hypothetical protein